MLHGVVVVDDLDAAAPRSSPAGLTAVTVDGDLLAPDRASGGSGAAASALDVQAAVDEAATAREAVERGAGRGCAPRWRAPGPRRRPGWPT